MDLKRRQKLSFGLNTFLYKFCFLLYKGNAEHVKLQLVRFLRRVSCFIEEMKMILGSVGQSGIYVITGKLL